MVEILLPRETVLFVGGEHGTKLPFCVNERLRLLYLVNAVDPLTQTFPPSKTESTGHRSIRNASLYYLYGPRPDHSRLRHRKQGVNGTTARILDIENSRRAKKKIFRCSKKREPMCHTIQTERHTLIPPLVHSPLPPLVFQQQIANV